MAADAAGAVRDIATALGVVDVSGQVAASFFEHPLASVRGALRDAPKRAALVRALDQFMERDPALSSTGPPELRVYPLVDLDKNRLALGLRLTGDAGTAATTVVLLGRVVVDDAAGVGVDIEVPLVLASGNGVTAITGTPAGPVRLRGIVDLDGGATLAAEAIVDSSGGSFGLRVTGLEVGGNVMPPLEISSDAFTGDLTHVLTVVLNLAATALGAIAGGTAQDVITHLPGILGFDDAIPDLPLGELSRNPGTMRRWLSQLVGGDAAGLRAWLTHLTGLMGLTAPAFAARPTRAQPWLVPLIDGPPALTIAVAVEPGGDGIDVLELGLRVALDTPVLLDATISASTVVVRLPLGGTASETWFPSIRVEVTAPAAGTTTPLVPVTGDFGVGRITAGVVVDAGAVHPSVVLSDVTVAGRPYPRLDLSSADALSASGGTVLSGALDDLLGTTGFAEDILVLIGLRSPGGGTTIDLGHLASDPLQALAVHHLSLLQGAGWGEPLAALAHLLGAATGAVTSAGPGVARIQVVDTAIGALALVATTGSDAAGGAHLDLGLEVSASLTSSPAGGATPTEPVLRAAASLVRFTFAADGSVKTTGFDAARVAIRTTGVSAGPLRTTGVGLDVGWSAGRPGAVTAALKGVSLDLPALAGDHGIAATLDLGDLALPWAPDSASPLAGLGVPDEAVADLLAWALRTLAATAGPLWGAIAHAGADAIPSLLADAPDVPALLSDLAGLGQTIVARLATGAANGIDIPALVEALRGTSVGGASPRPTASVGTGAVGDPWSWLLDGASSGAALTAWVEPGGPGTSGLGEAGDSGDSVAVLLGAATAASPNCAASLAGRALGDLASAVTELDGWVADGGGLWPATVSAPTAAWGVTITADQVLVTSPFADDTATQSLASTLDGWSGANGVLVCVAPSWWPIESWEPLLQALGTIEAAAGRERAWAALDLRRDPTAALGILGPADAYLVTATGSDASDPGSDAALASALSKVAAVTGRRLVVAAVATTFAPAAQWVSSAGATAVAGVAAIVAPLGAAPPLTLGDLTFAGQEYAAAVDVLNTIFSADTSAPAGRWVGLVRAWREAAEGMSVPTSVRPAGVGVLSAAFAVVAPVAAAAAAGALPGGVPRVAYVVASAPSLTAALADTVSGMPVTSPPRTGLALGVRMPIALATGTGPIRAQARADLVLGRVSFAPGGPAGSPLGVRASLDLTGDGPGGTGWLLGPPASGSSASVRRLTLTLAADLDAEGKGSAEIVLHDVRVGGVPVARCRRGDAGFDTALAAAVTAVRTAAASGDAHCSGVLALLRDDLGILDATGAVAATALGELLDDTAGWLASRARARLTAGSLLGLLRDPSAPVGTQRWKRVLTPTLAAVLEHSGPAWRLTVQTVGTGLALADTGHLIFATTGSPTAATVTTWRLDLPGAVLERTATDVTVALAGRPAVRVWPLSSTAEAAAVVDELVPYVPAALGSGLLSALLGQLGIDVPAAGLIGLLRDPAGELVRRLTSPSLLPDVIGALAEWLGLPTSQDGAVQLVDGVAEIAARSSADGPQVVASTPAGGWAPVPGLHLAASAGVTLGAGGTVLPLGAVALTIDLPAAVASAWTSVTISAEASATGLRLRVIPTPGDPIELVPQFSGVASLVGAGVERFLPMVLNLLRDEIPVGAARAQVIDLARAVGIYGTLGFHDGPVPLQTLSAQSLMSRAPQIGTALTTLLAGILGVQADGILVPIGAGGTTKVAVAQTTDGVTTDGVALRITGPLGSTIVVTLVTAGPGARIALTGLQIGPVLAEVTMSAVKKAGTLDVSGTARVDVDLSNPLRIQPRPSLRANLATDGTVSVVLLPLGEAFGNEASVTLAPVPALKLTATGGTEFVLRWLVVPGLEALVLLLGDALDTELGTPQTGRSAPTLRTLLTGAGLIAGDHVVASLPSPVGILTGAVSSIASTLSIAVAPGVDLHLVADGTDIGIALAGTVRLGSGDWQPSLLLGRVSSGSDGLVLTVLHKTAGAGGLGGTGWDFTPKITIDEVGASLTREGGLLTTSAVTIHDAGAWLGTSFALDPTTGSLMVAPLTGGVRVGGLGLPALSGGGGGNPVAGSLLGDSSRNGAPINPPLSFDVIWTGANLELHLDGTGPGETLWIQVGRTFGPLHIDRIGVRTGDGEFGVDGTSVQTGYIAILIDGGVVAGPLSIAVQGLGLSIPPRYATRPALWKVDLDGLAIDFRSASVTIAGGMLKATVLDPSGQPLVVNGHPVVDYRGMLQVQVFSFGATALGAYSQIPRPDGTSYTSLFLFAAINAPIGGPPYLFLTGLAGGFGVNRDFLPPSSIDAIGGFPLVAVMGSLTVPPEQVLANMGPSLPPRDGAYWFAAGVTFTTFELIKTRALAYFAFNPQGFQIGLLGLMTAALPTAENTLAVVELGLRAWYSSIDAVLGVQAQLTANSWLFSKDCRLTGGFAFVVWFNRPQVVLTVGGYGPLYPAPDYFPQVPPLGFQWRFSDDIVIKGESYFAVTPEAMMAGGRLEVSAKGGWGHGSLEVYADFIVWFHPPLFEMRIGIRITGKAFGFRFDLSASVYLRLPPIYGKVHVNFLWGFDFEFGEVAGPPPFLSLEDFITRFVDSTNQMYTLRVLTGAVAGTQAETPDGTPALPFRVLPEFTIDVTSKLPARSVSFGAYTSTTSLPLFAVPMGAVPALDPTLVVAMTSVDTAGTESPIPAARHQRLVVSVAEGAVASALWAGTPQIGTIATPDPASLTGSDMRRVPAGIAMYAPPLVTTPAGLAAIAMGAVIDDTSPRALLLDAPVAAAVRATPVVRLTPTADRGVHVIPEVVPEPVLRWSSGRVTVRSALARTALKSDEVQVWDLAHHLPSGRVAVTGQARVVAVNLMGDVILDMTTDAEVDLPAEAASVVVERAPAAGNAIGWDLTTSLRPLTAWSFLGDGACVQLPAAASLPGAGASEAAGVPAHAVVRSFAAVCTRMATGPGTSVVVAVDALSTSADLAGITVATQGGTLGQPVVLGSAAVGRVHLVYPVVGRDGPTLDVSVATAPDSWSVAGTAGWPTPVAAVVARFTANPWAALLGDPVARVAVRPAVTPAPGVTAVAGMTRAPRRAATISFVPPEPVHG